MRVQVFDQLRCLVPARLQSPHTAKVSEHIGLGHLQTLQKGSSINFGSSMQDLVHSQIWNKITVRRNT
jgi:hypothetical protein